MRILWVFLRDFGFSEGIWVFFWGFWSILGEFRVFCGDLGFLEEILGYFEGIWGF